MSGPMAEVAGRRPIDITAALVTSKGFAFEHDLRTNQTETDGPASLAAPPQTYPHPMADLRGTRRGRVVIVGFYQAVRRENPQKPPKHIWAARCDCGRYLLRDGQAWRSGLNQNKEDHGCSDCIKTDLLRLRGILEMHGQTAKDRAREELRQELISRNNSTPDPRIAEKL